MRSCTRLERSTQDLLGANCKSNIHGQYFVMIFPGEEFE